MTALSGFWSPGGDPAALRSCTRILDAQKIYAPNAGVTWSEGGFAMGRRLFKLLPEDAFDRGPVIGGGGNLVLVGDVRLDNRDALAGRAGVAPGEARALSDCALLMRVIERFGEAALDFTVGDFAFALWNVRERRLMLARDFLGHKPLCYYQGSDFFAFASMAKGLHALPQVPYGPDARAAAEFLALLPETGSQTFFKDIAKVEPGHVVTITADGISARRYWDPSPEPLKLRRREDYIEAVREQLDIAVSCRLRGAGSRVSSHLSAGLDSSAVTATAARLMAERGGRVSAFTAVPRAGFEWGGRRFRIADEGPLAAATAALYPNIDHVLVDTVGRSPLDALDRNFLLYERPALNLCNGVWTDAINDAARKEGNILLTGLMGNLSFSFTGMTLLPELLGRGRLLALAKCATALMREGMAPRTIASQMLGPFMPVGWWQAVNRLYGRTRNLGGHKLIHPDIRDAVGKQAREQGHDTSYRPRGNSFDARINAMRGIDVGNYYKGMLGGWGLDMRDPTADRRLVELCLAIPDEQYLTNGEPRALARAVLADRLPDAVLTEKRKGYQGADWHEALTGSRDQLRGEVDRISNCGEAATTVDTKRMDAMMQDWPSGDWDEAGTRNTYRFGLLRGISAGHFIRKATGSNQ